jgi:hypothetical protein
MEDKKLDKLDIIKYVNLIKTIQPDLFTTIEIPIYDGDSGKLLILSKRDYLDQLQILSNNFDKKRIIVLISGRIRKESLAEISIAYKFGFRKFGLTCADSMQRNQSKCRAQIRRDLSIIKKFQDTESYIFGLTSPRNLEEFSGADFLVTKGWYYAAWKRKEKLSRTKNLKDKIYPFFETNNQTCLIKNGIEKINIDLWNKKRHDNFRKIAFSNIQVLLEKLDFMKKQKLLEEFTRCLSKEVEVLG